MQQLKKPIIICVFLSLMIVGFHYTIQNSRQYIPVSSQSWLAKDDSAPVPTTIVSPPIRRERVVPVVVEPVKRSWQLALKPIPSSLQKSLKGLKAGVLVDFTDRKIIWEKNSNKVYGIASMTKIMTAVLCGENLRNGKLKLQSIYPVSKSAADVGERQIWLETKQAISVESLGYAMMVHSANDASHLMGELVAMANDKPNPLIDSFVKMMNEKAKSLECHNMVFYNPHGLTVRKNRRQFYNKATPLEMVTLAEELLKFPTVMKWCGTKNKQLKIKNRKSAVAIRNTNNLLGKYPGVDGMKTGFTNIAGSCITISCLHNGHRYILVLMGAKNSRSRDRLAKMILDNSLK